MAAAALVGCGEDRAGARLVVGESLPALPVHVEGSVSYLRITRSDGGVVLDDRVTDGREVRGERPVLDRRLPSGRYELASYQRPCQGTCEVLDPPTDRCSASVRLADDDTRTVVVTLEQAGGCRIRVTR